MCDILGNSLFYFLTEIKMIRKTSAIESESTEAHGLMVQCITKMISEPITNSANTDA